MKPTDSHSWWRHSPWTLGLGGLMLLMNLGLFIGGAGPQGTWINALQFDRQAILQGQLWRLVTGNLVHWSCEHFLLDVGVFLVVGLLYERSLGRWYPWILGCSALVAGLAVLILLPNMAVYRGLSGVDSGQFAAALAVECSLAVRESRRWIWVGPIAAVFVFKILYEVASGRMLFGTESLGNIGLPTPVVHAAGTIAATALVAVYFVSKNEQRLRRTALRL